MAKTKQRAREAVTIRFKSLSGGRKSIYLDCYRDGRRTYEFLKLYLMPGDDQTTKIQNKNTLNAAEAIKAQRTIELANGAAGLAKHTSASKMLFTDWIRVIEGRSATNGKHMGRCLRQLGNYINAFRPTARLCDIDKTFCRSFFDWLRNDYKKKTNEPLTGTTLNNTLKFFNLALNSALREEYIQVNPLRLLAPSEKPKRPESKREFLTMDEIKRLEQTPCRNDETKRAFLFSCFCGLRISDVRAISWGDIQHDSRGIPFIYIITQKTKESNKLSLEAAAKWLPDRNCASDKEKIFKLPVSSYIGVVLSHWAREAGITKHVTFHVARHTFATLSLTLGVPIEVVSKLLNHSNLATTQVYAKVIDENKDKAVSRLAAAFNNNTINN